MREPFAPCPLGPAVARFLTPRDSGRIARLTVASPPLFSHLNALICVTISTMNNFNIVLNQHMAERLTGLSQWNNTSPEIMAKLILEEAL